MKKIVNASLPAWTTLRTCLAGWDSNAIKCFEFLTEYQLVVRLNGQSPDPTSGIRARGHGIESQEHHVGGCDDAALSAWTTLRTCLARCDSNAIEGFDSPH